MSSVHPTVEYLHGLQNIERHLLGESKRAGLALDTGNIGYPGLKLDGHPLGLQWIHVNHRDQTYDITLAREQIADCHSSVVGRPDVVSGLRALVWELAAA